MASTIRRTLSAEEEEEETRTRTAIHASATLLLIVIVIIIVIVIVIVRYQEEQCTAAFFSALPMAMAILLISVDTYISYIIFSNNRSNQELLKYA